jgi:hypothetical protein
MGCRLYEDLAGKMADKLKKEAAGWPVFTHTVVLVRVS